MRPIYLLLITATLLNACRTDVKEFPDGLCDTYDLGTPPSVDLATPAPKCAAADGLRGDNLLCVDFKDVPMPSSLGGWNFFCGGATSWSTASKVLEVNDFRNFMSTCTFTLPALSAADYQKYSRFTLSIIHKLDVNDLQQKAQIMLGADDQSSRLLDWMTGKQPRKQWTQTVAKVDLPLMAMGGFQPLFKITSSVGPGGGYTGWQIESIAIHGIP